MSSLSDPSAVSVAPATARKAFRVAFVGSSVWLDVSAPAAAHGLVPRCFPLAHGDDVTRALADLADFEPQATVVFDPPSLPSLALEGSAGVSLGVLVAGMPDEATARALDGFDRVASFAPALTGASVGRRAVWRAFPPPVSDSLFREVRPVHGAPQVMSVGRSTRHREKMLLAAKHHHDLLQLLHGVSGQTLLEILTNYDVGVYIAREAGGGFGQQVGMHLAAGQLLITDALKPEYGLERNIDYLQVKDADQLVWMLDRFGRFPEMHHRIRVRGRMKAEQYRSSRLFARIVHDLLADVAAFGDRGQPT